MTNALHTTLLQRIDAPAARYAVLDRYYVGEQPLAFLAPEARKALGDRFGRIASNLCRLSVTSIAERLRVTGFTGADVWDDWLRNDLDQLAPVAHREALLLGANYVVVWADAQGRPQVSIESAHQMSVVVDPGTRQIVAACKRWTTDTTTEATIFEANKVTRLRANNVGATTAGFETVEVLDNPLGVVPVVRLANTDRILGDPVSEIADLIPLSDALNKILADMMVGSEFYARPRRWATGVELVEEPVVDDEGNPVLDEDGVPVVEETSPYPEETNRMMIAEQAEAKFGQLEASGLTAYSSSIEALLTQIMAVSALPAHYVGITSANPASADAMRAAEAALTARAEAKQALFGRAWEQVARLIVAVRDGVDPAEVQASVQWADPSTRSIAQEADAVVKLHQAGLLPATYALKRLGYSDSDIVEIRTATRLEAMDSAGADVTSLLPSEAPR
ncbi:phage portal protein [Gordonia sp. Swx-4]|uniref:phage portal protein n=1 Tax=Gordonia sp. Swx-4 TaxID=3029399 RepID=UPI002572F8E4|nr:phage portal protein [Gordonia sp. Swx-4]WJG11643.1 phage portal protein [Gordonia sp. Swx-4]